MSGSSYEYLCFKDASDILGAQHQLERMSERLAKLGYAEDAAQETEDVLLTIRAFENRMNTRLQRLSEIWRAVEWWDSGDSGEERLKLCLQEYRGENAPLSAT